MVPTDTERATDHPRAGMGKLRPAGHIRPVRLLNPARRTYPNYSKNRIHLALSLQRPVFPH